MTISFVDFDDVDTDDPNDAYWAVVERISMASKTYNHENAGPLRMASTLRFAKARCDAAHSSCWPKTG